MSRFPTSVVAVALLLPVLAACGDSGPPSTAPRNVAAVSSSRGSAPRAQFERYVALGYSIDMGFMDGGVYFGSQEDSWPAQLARMAGVPFTQPLIDATGCRAPLIAPLSSGLRTDGTAANSVATVCSPLRPGVTAPTQNLAITNAFAEDALRETAQSAAAKRPFRGALYSRVLGSGYTQVTAMRAQSPRFVSVDLNGSELVGARQGLVALRPAGSLVSYADWSSAYDQVIENVKAADAGALLVAFPSDFALLGGLRRGRELYAVHDEFTARYITVDAACNAADGENLVYVPDKVFAAVAAGIVARAAGGPPAMLTCANVPGRLDGVLTPEELAQVNAMQALMNDHVRELARANGFAFVSYDELLDRPHFKSRFSLAALLDSDSPYGRFLSLDDLHPNPRGSRIMARAAARALNRTYNVGIPAGEGDHSERGRH